MKPPYKITPKIIKLVADISKLLGNYESLTITKPAPKLRRQNKIRTIKSTLAIEGNSCSLEQVTAILEHKRVVGKQKEILEVQNAIKLYESLGSFDPYQLSSFLKAHNLLMKGLVSSAGKWRDKNVGVLDGTKVKHVAPKPSFVPKHMKDLFGWAKEDKDIHYLIKSAIIHYEIEFIHPFEDGNGRMGRFWQTLLLSKNDAVFQYLPIESLIEKKQNSYYKVLEKCDRAGDSTGFIEFILNIIKETIDQFFKEIRTVNATVEDRLEKAGKVFAKKDFSRKEYLAVFKNISTATASRDLKHAVDNKILVRSGEKSNTIYKFSDI